MGVWGVEGVSDLNEGDNLDLEEEDRSLIVKMGYKIEFYKYCIWYDFSYWNLEIVLE